MHVHLPKPTHGWREFFGEVGIIVLGVLIALGAEQVVEAYHWRHQVHQFREALDEELAYDLSAYDFRMRQERCVDRRIAQLDAWLADAATDPALPLSAASAAPVRISQYRSVWDLQTGDLANHIPLRDRLSYAQLYDELRLFEQLQVQEGQAWTELTSLQGQRGFDRAELLHVRHLLKLAQSSAHSIAGNHDYVTGLAARLHIPVRRETFGLTIAPCDVKKVRPVRS